MIEDMIQDLKRLDGFTARVAKRAAKALEAEAKKTIAAGTDPEGKVWKPKKKPARGRPLANAAQALHVEVEGDIVTLVLEGPETWHQRSKEGSSLPKRKMIPDPGDPIPENIRKVMDEASAAEFRAFGGGG